MNIIGRSKIWFILSTSLVVLSVIFFAVFGLNLGIDFSGGTLIESKIKSENQLDNNLIEETIKEADKGLKTVKIQKTGDDQYLIKTDYLSQEKHNQLKIQLKEKFATYKENKVENIGPSVSQDLKNKAIWAVILAALAIVIYIWWAFRRLPSDVSSFQFGVSAIVALLHDITIVVGVFALMGHFFTSVMIDSYFIVALLTVMGFSVHDTIVVFDRLRENLLKEGSDNFKKVANDSVNQTIIRSINISLTLIIVLISMYFLGGSGIRNFILALTVGTIIGTYSSIFVATPFVTWWHNRS